MSGLRSAKTASFPSLKANHPPVSVGVRHPASIQLLKKDLKGTSTYCLQIPHLLTEEGEQRRVSRDEVRASTTSEVS